MGLGVERNNLKTFGTLTHLDCPKRQQDMTYNIQQDKCLDIDELYFLEESNKCRLLERSIYISCYVNTSSVDL